MIVLPMAVGFLLHQSTLTTAHQRIKHRNQRVTVVALLIFRATHTQGDQDELRNWSLGYDTLGNGEQKIEIASFDGRISLDRPRFSRGGAGRRDP
jgi:hypothetical protein